MSDKVTMPKEDWVAALDAARAKSGVTKKLLSGELAGVIHGIESGITPSGTKKITENGTYDVKNYASAQVDVPETEPVIKPLSVTANGTYAIPANADGYGPVTVNVPTEGGGTDTSDATVTSGDLATGVIAYGADGRVVGNLPVSDAQTTLSFPNSSLVDYGTGQLRTTARFGSKRIMAASAEVALITAYEKYGNAAAEDVAKGKTFTSAAGFLVEGTAEGETEPVVESLTVTENGTYTAPGGVDGYSPVVVDVQPTLQTKTVTPAETAQKVAADDGYDGLLEVSVEAIPEEYVIPAGSKTITANGTHDVSGFASAVVNVPTEGGSGGTDTSDATATAADIAYGKTAYAAGEMLTGTLPDAASGGIVSGGSVAVTKNLESIQMTITNSTDRILRSGAKIFGVTSPSVFGDAAAEDVAAGKTFTSAAGLKVVGTAEGSAAPVLQSLTVTANGVYTPGSGVDGYSSVVVNVPSNGSGDGLADATGTATASPIDTGLSEIQYLVLYKTSVTSTGLIQGVYSAKDGKFQITYCSSYSAWTKSFAVASGTPTVDGGTFTWAPSTASQGLNGTYTWIAVGKA